MVPDLNEVIADTFLLPLHILLEPVELLRVFSWKRAVPFETFNKSIYPPYRREVAVDGVTVWRKHVGEGVADVGEGVFDLC